LANALFYGSGTALITPFSGSSVDLGAWERLIENQLEAGTDALIVLGSTGEAATVSKDERLALISIALGMARGLTPVIVGVSAISTNAACALAETARDLGADGLLVAPPAYMRPNDEGITRHIEAVADAGELPVIAYNIPSRTGVNISPNLMCDMARHPLIQGIKEASNDASHISRMAGAVAGGLALYAGNDSQIINIMAQGGRGAITVAGNIAPYEVAAVTRAMNAGDIECARAAYQRIAPLVDALSPNPAAIKCAMSMVGACTGETRLPITPVSTEKRRIISKALDDLGLLRV